MMVNFYHMNIYAPYHGRYEKLYPIIHLIVFFALVAQSDNGILSTLVCFLLSYSSSAMTY